MEAGSGDSAALAQTQHDFHRLVTRLSTEFITLSAEELDPGIERALGLIGEYAGADRSYLFQLSPDRRHWSNTHEWVAPGVTREIHNLQNLSPSAFPWFWSRLQEGKAIAIPDVNVLPPEAVAERREYERESIHSLVYVPLFLDGGLVGFVGYDAVRRPRAWTEAEIALLELAGEMIALTLARRRVELARRLADTRLHMQHALAQILVTSASVEEAMPRVLATIGEALDWHCGAHWAWEEISHSLRRAEVWAAPRAAPGDCALLTAQQVQPLGKPGGFVRQAWRTHEPQWHADVTQEPTFLRAQEARTAGVHGAFAFPILAGEQPLGVLEFYSRAVREADAELLELTRTLGRQIGLFVARRRAEVAMRNSEERFRRLTALSADWFWEQDAALRYTLVTRGMLETAGFGADEFLGKTPWEIPYIWSEDECREHRSVLETRQAFRDLALKLVNRHGELRYLAVSGEPIIDADGVFHGYRGVGQDITERMQAQERLAFLANFDELTGLPNRLMFREHLERTMLETRRQEGTLAVLFLDLDEFKTINDTLGHATGDKVLKVVAERIQSSVRGGDTVSRLSGDEFALVLARLARADDAALVARNIITAISESFTVEGQELVVSASIGITLYPMDHSDADGLLKNADIAMYRAKEAGKNTFRFFSAEMAERVQARQTLEGALRRALARGEFVAHYQPIVEVQTGATIGAEALLRWQSGSEILTPDRFIAVAEDAGLILAIGEWVLRAACAQARTWDGEGLPPLDVSVNLSARQVHQRDLPRLVERVLHDTGLAPSRLILELTETALLRNVTEAEAVLREISALGVRFALDDFGTGYSSLSHLKRFPICIVKLDRSYVRDVLTDPNDAAIAAAICALGQRLGLKVVAEGVESAEQLAYLRVQGCQACQGFHFSRPLPPSEFSRWVTGRVVVSRGSLGA